MARFSISEAAKLLKISRKTIYKHISQGKVSAGLDPLGQKYIDAAELHRAYGDFPTCGDKGDKPETATLETVVTELRELRKAHAAVLNELKALREDVGAGRLLEHKPSHHDEKVEVEPAGTPRHSFASIMDKIKSTSD